MSWLLHKEPEKVYGVGKGNSEGKTLIVIPILSLGKPVHLVGEINFHITSKKTNMLVQEKEYIISMVCSNSEAT